MSGVMPNFDRVKTIWKSEAGIAQLQTHVTSLQYAFCPFTVQMGALNTTNAGYRGLTSIPQNYTQYSSTKTGREAYNVIWDNSWIPGQNPDDPNDTWVDFKAGDVWYGNLVSNSISPQSAPSGINSDFVDVQLVKRVSLSVTNDERNKSFFDNILFNSLKHYMLPDLNSAFIEEGNIIQTDRQWYDIEQIIQYYDNATKRVFLASVTFKSVNDSYNNTGLAVNQYIQLGSVGAPAAIPTLDGFGNVVLDISYLQPQPVTHVQEDFNFLSGKIASMYMGRPFKASDWDPQKRRLKIRPSQVLWPYNFQGSNYDIISLRDFPENNFFMTVKGSLSVETFGDTIGWQEKVMKLYDPLARKKYEGDFRSNFTKTKNTNSLDGNGKFLPYWDENFLKNADLDDYEYKPLGNLYFKWWYPEQKKIVGIPDQKVILNNIKNKNLRNVNLYQFMLTSPIDRYPLSLRETLRGFSNPLKSFAYWVTGLLGLGGLNPSGKISTNVLTPDFQYINFLISADLYEFYIKAIYNSEDKNTALIPFDLFRSDGADSLGSLLNSKNHVDSFTFNLTENMRMRQINIETNEVGNLVDKSTIDLIQVTDGTNINLADSSDSEALERDEDTIGYFIDSGHICVIGKGNYKLSFYSQPGQWEQPTTVETSIYTATYQTLAKAMDNIQIFKNNIIFANTFLNFNTPFLYPKPVLLPQLKDGLQMIYVELDKKQYQMDYSDSILCFQNTDSADYSISVGRYHQGQDLNKLTHISIPLTDFNYSNFSDFKKDYRRIEIEGEFICSILSSKNIKSNSLDYENKATTTSFYIDLDKIDVRDGLTVNFDRLDNSFRFGGPPYMSYTNLSSPNPIIPEGFKKGILVQDSKPWVEVKLNQPFQYDQYFPNAPLPGQFDENNYISHLINWNIDSNNNFVNATSEINIKNNKKGLYKLISSSDNQSFKFPYCVTLFYQIFVAEQEFNGVLRSEIVIVFYYLHPGITDKIPNLSNVVKNSKTSVQIKPKRAKFYPN